jgi:aminoglycoside/choline kinase family phosphotransferase
MHRLRPESVRAASADASFRRYFRIDTDAPSTAGIAQPSGTAQPPVTRIIMDAPPDKEDCAPFVHVAALMAQADVRAPQVLDWDREHGFMLLTDLGRQTLLDIVDPARPEAAQPLFLQAIDALVRWQLISRPQELPPYNDALLRRELALFPDWYIPCHRGLALNAAQRQTLEQAFDLIVRHNLASANVYVHRDYMPRNLMVPEDGGTALGVLDFQDAVYGPITYDIACLMRDAFISWDEEFVIDMTVRYWQAARKAGLPVDQDFGAFYRAVEWMGLQRHIKVAGIFARITLRDGKPKYLADAPRFITYIRTTAARYRELTPLLRLIDQIEGTPEVNGYAFGRM